MKLHLKSSLLHATALLCRLASFLFLLEAFRQVAHADPITGVAMGVSGIGSLLGGIFGSKAANKAADIQNVNAQRVSDLYGTSLGEANKSIDSGIAGASQALGGGIAGANRTLGDIYGQQREMLDPYLQAGRQGLDMLTQAVGPGGSLSGTFKAPTADEARATPGYEFAVSEAMKALHRSAAAQGSLQGGGTLKAITQYAQNLADTNYQNVFNNALTTFGANRNATLQNLSALTGVGEFGTGQFNSAAMNAGNRQAENIMQGNASLAQVYQQGAGEKARNIFNTAAEQGAALTGGANARAAGTVGSTNAWMDALSGIGNAVQFGALSRLTQPKPPISGAMPPGYQQPSVSSMLPAWNPGSWGGYSLPNGQY